MHGTCRDSGVAKQCKAKAMIHVSWRSWRLTRPPQLSESGVRLLDISVNDQYRTNLIRQLNLRSDFPGRVCLPTRAEDYGLGTLVIVGVVVTEGGIGGGIEDNGVGDAGEVSVEPQAKIRRNEHL